MSRPSSRAAPAGGGCVAFYGDDFTGSVDVLLQFARRGWRARLFVGRPSSEAFAEAARSHDAVGIAGIARSLPTAGIEREVGPALDLLLSVGPRLVQYKACSTADSSPEIGSLGRVLEVARDRIPGAVPLLFAQPDFGRYTAFGHHFAAERGTVYRLDRQPTMSAHPTTPMHESDLAEHLRAQTDLPVSNIPFTAYDDLSARLLATESAGVVLDALDESHLRTIGSALRELSERRSRGADGTLFTIGSGGLSHAIAAADPREAPPLRRRGVATGPVLVVSGSRSATTRRQADHAASAGWLVRPLAIGGGPHDDVIQALAAGRSVVLSSDDADTTGADDPLDAIARASADAVRAALAHTRRVIVAGGDTSSRVTALLGVRSLSLAANPWDNVVMLTAHADDPSVDGIELLLKGGQVGADDLFTAIRASQ